MSFIYDLLSDKITTQQTLINEWFQDRFVKKQPLFYNSVDLRHSGFKIAPIDNNCFPAGFNNLSSAAKSRAVNISHDFFQDRYPKVKNIIIIPENHTRNDKYLENVLTLKEIISKNQDIDVVIGSLIDDIDDQLKIKLQSKKNITLHKIIRRNDKIITKSGFEADLIISNNDFTNKPEEILNNLRQDIIPGTNLGWHNRTKSKHFDIYESLAKELSELIDIDPWLISSIHKNCTNIDFKNKKNIDNLASSVENVLANIKEKYKEYNINLDPYCYVKADNGTYGMAIMTVKNAEEILLINKKQRNKMNMLKGNIANNQVIIQEGIPTIDNIEGSPLEPMIYLMNGIAFGNIFRTNNNRDNNISLNSTGMEFRNLDNIEQNFNIGGNIENIFPIYNILARLSALASSYENEI